MIAAASVPGHAPKDAATRTLFVLHTFGPDHVRLMSVDGDGTLTPRPERYSVNTRTKTDLVTTSATLSPDERFLLVGTIFDVRPSANPDGTPKYGIANTSDPDGLVVFPVGGDGTLGAPSFHDGGGGVPFYFAFTLRSGLTTTKESPWRRPRRTAANADSRGTKFDPS